LDLLGRLGFSSQDPNIVNTRVFRMLTQVVKLEYIIMLFTNLNNVPVVLTQNQRNYTTSRVINMWYADN